MLNLTIDSTKFDKDMRNIIQYSLGFFEGVKQGTPAFLKGFGITVVEGLKQYIDANARVNPSLLHHVYEWNETGSPNARLFDIEVLATGNNVSFFSSFRQSSSIKNGSNVPFYDKARIMEEGIPVTIVPKKRVLVFEDGGETIFTTNPVTVRNPGGDVAGEFERVFRSFFTNYFTQSYIQSAGILAYLGAPTDFLSNLSAKGGRSKGVAVGRNWITKAGDL
jgi:hypothetical protein